jgi:tRNA(Ile)-lysidine synthase
MPFVHDVSNDDLHIPRNRIRAELLPLLERRFNPSIVAALAHEADLAREEWRWMEMAADEAMPALCRRHGDSWRIDAEALGRLPVALARTVVRRAMTDGSQGRPVGFMHVEAVLQVACRSRGPVDLPRHRVERIGPDVVLSDRTDRRAGRGAGRRAGTDANLFRYPLSIPGEVDASEEAGWAVSAEPVPSLSDARSRADVSSEAAVAAVAIVQRDVCGPGLAVRNWRPGDRFRPLGLGGHKKLQDFFVDRKVIRQERSSVPLVVDERDRIVWVAGHAISDDFRVTDPAQAVGILRLKLVGGPA